jgi:kanamycin kinase
MKRTLTTIATGSLPLKIRALADGAAVYDSSCSPEARVYFIDRGDGYYLKIAERGTLAREARMSDYFHSIGLGVKVVAYVSEERD